MRARPEGLIDGIARKGLLIGGDHVPKATGGVYVHHDPATGRPQAEVPLAGADDVDQAVRSAEEAGPAWRAVAPDRRAAILFRLADLLEAHAEECAVLGALENGSPVSIMQPALYTASWVRYYAGWVDKLEGRVVPTYANSGLDYVRYEPYGVVGVLPPWNGPMMGMGQKAAPALAAGNTVVAKPPEIAPFGAYRFAELALEAGLPPGVLNVVAGGADAGEALVRHPAVGKVSFTGGRDTARRVIEASAATIKPLTLELGGKSANIIFDDADLDTVIPIAAMTGAILLSGQGCALPIGFGIQDSAIRNDMLLMLDYGIYYEFLPLENLEKKGPCLSLNEVKAGVNYALIISTSGGLWRYMVGDTIQFTSTDPYRFIITGRTKQFINAFGEELVMANVEKAIQVACERTNAYIEEYTVAPVYMKNGDKGSHEWLIEFRKSPSNMNYFREALDNALKAVNSDYEAKRYKDMTLTAPVIHAMPEGTFFEWMKKRGKLGGQNKVPRLSNDRKYVDDILSLIDVTDATKKR